MFQFLNPIWLFAAAAIVIPVLIHLWNIRPGKVLKVGSISLINAASRKSSRSFKLLDIPLFIVRCLLLLLLALLLAMPVWEKKLQTAKAKGWLLVPKETFKETYNKFKPTIDSLNKAGYEFHYFNAGFAKSNLQQILLHPKDSITSSLPDPHSRLPNYWSLVKQLNNRVDYELPVYLFTPNQSSHFTGSRPEVALNMRWQTYTPADSVSNWIQDAWFTTTDNIRVVQGNSTPKGTTYTFSTVSSSQSDPDFSIQTNDGKAEITLANSKQAPVTISTTTQYLLIYTDNNTPDAGYLKAALQAVSQFTQRKTVIKIISNAGQIPQHTQWLFWLSEKPISQQAIGNCEHVLMYKKGKPVTVNSWITNAGRFATALPDGAKVSLFKMINAAATSREGVWQNGFGEPVLAVDSGETKLYHFYSRFNPAWNDLVWSDTFPAWLLQLMQNQPSAPTEKFDKRLLSRGQYLPLASTKTHTVDTAKPVDNKSLTHYFWIALMLIFATERLLAHRTPKTDNA